MPKYFVVTEKSITFALAFEQRDAFEQKRSLKKTADMAQLVEQRIRNAWVAGSSPAIGSHVSEEPETRDSGSFSFRGISPVGRALASQAEGRGFESRIPLLPKTRKRKKISENEKKVMKTFGGFKKSPYLCTRNQGDNPKVCSTKEIRKDG